MRRCLHAFLVGVLMLSLSMNAARACWYLRHGHHARHHVVVACPPAAPACPEVVHAAWVPVAVVQVPVVEVVEAWGCECGAVTDDWAIAGDVVEGALVDEGCSCDCGASDVEQSVDLHAEPLVEEHGSGATIVEPAVEEVIHHGTSAVQAEGAVEEVVATEPTLAEPVADQAETVMAKPAPTPAAVPVLEPTEEVRQAVAIAESAPKPEPDVVLPAEPTPATEIAPEPASPPAGEENIFEEVDQAATGAAARGVEEFRYEPPARGAPEAEEPAAAGATEPELPGAASEPPPAPEDPADPFSAAGPASREPARRWIDRSGDYAVIGTLRAVRGDGTCELEAEGRTIRVPLEALSDFDRAYVTAASPRLAVRPAPESGDTAGL